MFDLRDKLTAGQLADFTRSLREQKPDDWDGNVFALPDMELCLILVNAARKAGWYEQGQAPTLEQVRGMTFDEAVEVAESIMELFTTWNKRAVITIDEKKSTKDT